MPGLKAVIDSLDDVDEALRALFEPKDGKFILSIEGVDDHPAVRNLKSAHETVKTELRKVKTDLKTATDKLATVPDDFDPDELARLKAEEEARKANPDNKDVNAQIAAATAAVKAQYEARIASDKRKHDSEIKTRDEKNGSLAAQVRRMVVDDGLTKALTEAGVTSPALLKGAKAMLERSVEVVDEDGEPKARMKPDLGAEEIAKYITNWVQSDEGKAFVTPASGTGAPGNSRQQRGSESNPFSADAWNKTHQGQMLKADRGKADRLAKAAGFVDLDAGVKAVMPLKKSAA